MLEIYSKGLYSSWCYHTPSRTLFDCGEGFATYQGNFIYGVERILLSHGHGDHTLGLPPLISCRNMARGDRKKPLQIYYPHDNYSIPSLRKFIEDRNTHSKYAIEWIPIMGGYTIPLNNKQEIQSFPMLHQKNGNTLGYRILEKRTKLKSEFEGKNIPELLKLGRVIKEDLTIEYTANIFAYCLDAYRVDSLWLKNCELGVMDCTFLHAKDRTDDTHYTLNEAVKIFFESGGKKMIAAHISPRYNFHEIIENVDNCKQSITPICHGKPVKI